MLFIFIHSPMNDTIVNKISISPYIKYGFNNDKYKIKTLFKF